MRRELVVLALIGCGPASVPCPSGTHADATRASAIEARLETTEEGRALMSARSGVSAVCFGDATRASVITSTRVIVLANGLEEGEAAARLGHLLVHARDGLPNEVLGAGQGDATCDAAVEHALRLEAHAYVVEVALQDALDAHPTMLAFEFAPEMRAAPPNERESIALAYLHAHPLGGPGIDGLESGYRALCRQ